MERKGKVGNDMILLVVKHWAVWSEPSEGPILKPVPIVPQVSPLRKGIPKNLPIWLAAKKYSLIFGGFDPTIGDYNFFVAWNVKCWEACLKSVTKCKLTRQHHHASANLLRFLEPYRQQSNKKYLLISYNLWSSWWFTKCLWSASACQCKPPQIVKTRESHQQSTMINLHYSIKVTSLKLQNGIRSE